MSLRAKIVVILSAVVLLYAVVDHVLQRTLVFKSFVQLEESEADKDLERVVHAVRGEIEHLTSDCAGCAASEATYRFAAEGNAPSLGADVIPQALHGQDGQDLTLLYVCDTRGSVVWGRIRDTHTGASITLRDFPERALAPSHPLLTGRDAHERVSGVFMTEVGPLLVSAEPVKGSKPEAPSRGTLIFGRLLDAALVQQFVRQTGVHFNIWPANAADLPDEVAQIAGKMVNSPHPVLVPRNDERLEAFTGITDVNGAPALIVRADIDRDVTARGDVALHYALLSTIAAGLLLMLVLLHLLQRTVLKPLGALTQHAVEIGHSEDFTRRIRSERTDEVGVLSREFDSMIEKVEQSRAAVVKAARAAGMSEIATGVLHNVGNVLNSVNVSAALVSDRLHKSASSDLSKIVSTLEPHAGDLGRFVSTDPRGQHLFPLLASVARELDAEHQRTDRDVKTLREGIAHIKDLVVAQQNHAGGSGVFEIVSIAEQIEAAVTFTGQALAASAPVEIVREIQSMAPCRIERHRLMGILVNLIQNARQASREPGRPARIVIRLCDVGAGRARIEVQDDGVGIARENITRIFTHGFTTKRDGHGFGLHASANAATEMGGKLTAHSDGPGHGATFVLEFPIATATACEVKA